MMSRETTKIQMSLAVPIFQLPSSYHFKRMHGDFLSHKQSPFRMVNYLISKVHGAFLLNWLNLSNNLTKLANFETYWFIIYHFCPAKNGFFKTCSKSPAGRHSHLPTLGFSGWTTPRPTFNTFETKGVLMEETKEEFKFVLVDFLIFLRKNQH